MAGEGLSARILVDELTPAAQRLTRGLTAPQKILEAVGLQIVSITQRAFRDASVRVSAWAPKRDGSPATLIKSGDLRRSIRIINIGSTSVTVGSDKIYAAIQQLGSRDWSGGAGSSTVISKSKGTTVTARRQNIPPRPFFPIKDGQLSQLAKDKIAKVVTDAIRALLKP